MFCVRDAQAARLVWIGESHPEEWGDAVEGGDEGFGFGAGVVEGEGGAHGAFDAERFHSGWAQWWPVRTAMPSLSRSIPVS